MKASKSNNKNGMLCSGYKVFPDGSKCKGCIDCDFLKSTKSIKQVFNQNHSTIKVGRKTSLEKITKLLVR